MRRKSVFSNMIEIAVDRDLSYPSAPICVHLRFLSVNLTSFADSDFFEFTIEFIKLF